MLLENFVELFLESAPWLLLGLLLAGLLKVFVPMKWMQKQLGGAGIKSTVKAALIGAPLPLCSCGVIPAAVGLRRSGASKAATTSFLVATPETGVDSVTVSYVLLGPFMAVVRPVTAIISAIVAGLLVGRDEQLDNVKTDDVQKPTQSSCCSKKKQTSCCSEKKGESSDRESCESENDIAQNLQGTAITHRLLKGLHFAATDLIKDTSLWLLVGLFFAALVKTYVATDFLVAWGDGILAMLVMVIVSVPMYICATASTPIAAGLLLAGISPGAVLVFMLAGPATNIATLGVVAKELGKRALWGYLGGVLSTALIAGVVVNELVERFGFMVMPQIGEHHQLLPDAVTYSAAVVLAILMVKVFVEMLFAAKPKKGCCSEG